MGKFHRFTGKFKKDDKAKKRVPTNKKKIRDIERMIAKEGVPEEIRVAKRKVLKELKKIEKKKKEADLFELKYKKIKFFGKS